MAAVAPSHEESDLHELANGVIYAHPEPPAPLTKAAHASGCTGDILLAILLTNDILLAIFIP